jgi:hypothetical protein
VHGNRGSAQKSTTLPTGQESKIIEAFVRQSQPGIKDEANANAEQEIAEVRRRFGISAERAVLSCRKEGKQEEMQRKAGRGKLRCHTQVDGDELDL